MPRRRLSVDLACNLGWPFAILTWASSEDLLGPRWAPAVAMLAPLGFAVWRRVTEGRTSALSVLVLISIVLNAVAGFLPLDPRWFAAKEALLPVGFGLVFAATALRGPGLLADILHEVVDAAKVAAALAERDATVAFHARLRRGTVRFGAVFGLSGALGGGLALALVRSPSGTSAFAEELGRYTAWSYGVVNLPVLVASAWVLQDVLTALESGTGRTFEELQA